MTDRDLVIAAAREVMGWHEWEGSDDYGGPYPMFRFWGKNGKDAAVYEDKETGDITRWWNPLTSDADAFMLVDRLNPTDFSLEKSGANWTATLATGEATVPGDGADARRRAIVLCHLRAKGVLNA